MSEVTCKLMWLPAAGEPWPALPESPWRHRFVSLPAVPRKGEFLRLEGKGWEVFGIVWEPGQAVEVRIQEAER